MECKCYNVYINNYVDALQALKDRRSRDSTFDKFLVEWEKSPKHRSITVESFMITPIQRMPRYLLFLRELAKYTGKDHLDYPNIQIVTPKFEELTTFLNESKRAKEKKDKLQEMKKLVLNVDEQEFANTKFIIEGHVKKKKTKESVKLLQESLDSLLAVTSPKRSPRNSLLGAFSPRKEQRAEKTETVETAEKHKTAIDTKGDTWREMLVYLFGDSLFCAKKISARTVRQFSNSLVHAFKGTGWHKFSAMKSIKLTNAVVDTDPAKPTTFFIRGCGDGVVHEFQTETPRERDKWLIHFKSSIATVLP